MDETPMPHAALLSFFPFWGWGEREGEDELQLDCGGGQCVCTYVWMAHRLRSLGQDKQPQRRSVGLQLAGR